VLDELPVFGELGWVLVPVPVRLTAIEVPADELLEMIKLPPADAALAGVNFTVKVSDWPGINLAGNVPPDTEKPAPCRETELMSSGHVPADVNVTD
jgi:hypothetical protein